MRRFEVYFKDFNSNYSNNNDNDDNVPQILWDFKLQTDLLIASWRPDRVLITKNMTLSSSVFCRPSWTQKIKEREKKNTCPWQITKQKMEYVGDGDKNNSYLSWKFLKWLELGLDQLEIEKRNETIQTIASLE